MSKPVTYKEPKPVASQTVNDAREMMIRLGCPDLFTPPTPSTENQSHPPL